MNAEHLPAIDLPDGEVAALIADLDREVARTFRATLAELRDARRELRRYREGFARLGDVAARLEALEAEAAFWRALNTTDTTPTRRAALLRLWRADRPADVAAWLTAQVTALNGRMA